MSSALVLTTDSNNLIPCSDADIPAERLYRPPIELGQSMDARVIAKVIQSKSDRFREGDSVVASGSWSELFVAKAATCQPATDLPGGLSKTTYLGALGLTGLTAYFGLLRVGEAKAEDVVVVSGAAGATGSMVVQIAKHVVGCKKVIGIAGSEEKCRWVESIGADVCLNYKESAFSEKLTEATPEFASVYYDNVGGRILDLMLTRMAKHGRVIACGSIANYNTETGKRESIFNWFDVITMRLKLTGFIVTDFMKDFPQAMGALKQALTEGKIKISNEAETVVPTTFEDIPKTWLKLFDGSNQGKLITALEA